MSAVEARRQALVKLGGLEQTKEQHRDRRGLPWLETAFHDLRFALRLMRRNPGFTLVVLSTLAIGIGANTVMFSIVNTLLLRPLPYRDPAQLMFVQAVNATNRQLSLTAPPDFYAYRAQNRTLDHLEAFYFRFFNLTDGREAERISTLIVSAGLFTALGTEPERGRGFVSQEEQWGSHRVVILTDGLWQRRFGGDPRVLGQPITLNGRTLRDRRYFAAGFLVHGIRRATVRADVVRLRRQHEFPQQQLSAHDWTAETWRLPSAGVGRPERDSERNHRGAVGQPGNCD